MIIQCKIAIYFNAEAQGRRVRRGSWSLELELESGVVERSWRQERRSEAGEPTGARGNRRLSVVRAVHEPTRSESEGEHVCGPGVILTASVKGAREISAGQSPLAKQVARAVRARQKSCRWGARKLRVGIPRGEAEPRSGRYAGCEQVGRRPRHRAAWRRKKPPHNST